MFKSKKEKFAYVLGKNQGQKEEFRRYKKMSKSGGFRKTKSFEGKKKEKKRIVLFANDRNPKFDDSSTLKHMHFLGSWNDGEPMNVSVECHDKAEGWDILNTALKDGKFDKFILKNQYFVPENKTVEEERSGFFESGHTAFIVPKDGDVLVN